MEMTGEERRLLLQIARDALTQTLKGGSPQIAVPTHPALLLPQGVFVTLTKGKRLRGCMGRIDPQKALFQTVAEVARSAALEDPRFPSVTVTELPDLSIEISVLSPLQKTEASTVEVGRHGLMVKRGFAAGLLLPQVASEQGWSLEEFLAQTCLKAGLAKEAWRDKTTEIYSFTAEVFSEEDV